MNHRLAFLRASLPAFAVTAFLASPAAALAQEQERDEDEIIVTAQRDNATEVINGGEAGVLGDQEALDLPFQLRSFDEALIYNQQPLTLGDVLDNDPTVRTTFAFGNAAELFVIRGFALFGDDVGVNGLYGIAPRQLVAPELFERVEVLNGASAFLNGAAPGGSGLGGSVNLQLKRAGAEDVTRVTGTFVGDAHFGGSFDVARRFGENGEFGLRVNGAYRDGEVAIEREDRRAQVLGAAFDYDGGNFRAVLDLAYQEIRVDALRGKVNFGAAIPVVPESDANFAQDYTFTELTDIFGTLSLEYDLAPDVLLYARGGARSGDEEGVYGGIQVSDAITGEATSGFHSFIPFEASNEAIEAGLRAGFALGPTTHRINLGGNLIWQEDRTAFDFFQPFATNLFNPVQVQPQPTAFLGGDIDDPFPIARRQLSSLFVSDTVGLFGDRVLLTGGVRYQRIEENRFTFADGSPQSSYDEDRWTPVAGLVVQPTETLSFYANYIEALQQGPVAPIDPVPGLVNPGAALPPRVSQQFEIGGKLALGDLFASLALYRIERPGEGVFLNADDRAEFGYLGDQRHEGIELTLNGELARGLRLISGLAFNDAKLADDQAVVGVPEFTFNTNLEWDLAFVPGLTLTGRVTHTGEQAANAADTLQLEPWTVVDLGARYVVPVAGRPVTLRLTVDNVLGEAYWASAFDAFNPALLQGAPRTAKASASIAF
ncbi:MAG: TonB-dependent receptor [Erythrobacter sp.]|jgi:iron complex outermembrane receptor protein|nr:TonB-dependent receptor [Erythrobacter sp.]